MTEHQLHAILPRIGGAPAILMLPTGSGWSPPDLHMPPEEGEGPYDFFKFGMAVRDVHGCAAAALYNPYFVRKNDEHDFRFVFVVENRDPSYQPAAGARWLTRAELDGLPLDSEYLRPIIETWFEEQATGSFPPERPPWAFPGWEDRAAAWIAAQVEAQGGHLTGVVELVRKWAITCVMKAPTDAGMVFFKAVPPTFAREIEITRFLAARLPDKLPSIIASDSAERWLLLRDFGSDALGDTKDVALWERALQDFAALQVEMSRHPAALLERGAMDYRLDVLPAKLDALLADESIMQPDHRISADELDRVKALAPRLKGMIAELGTWNIAPTLVHGDFHAWNVAVRDGRVIFFDWTDAALGHPFFDMAFFFVNITKEVFPGAPDIAGRLRDSYLQALTPLAPLESLQETLWLGEVVGLVQQAVNYRHLLRHLEPAERWSLSFTSLFLKEILTRLEPGSAST